MGLFSNNVQLNDTTGVNHITMVEDTLKEA